MNLFIQIADGQPVNHPMLETNVLEFYGVIPEDFVPFHRVSFNDTGLTCGVFQKTISIYVNKDGTWQDEWAVVDMTPEERQEKIDRVQSKPPGLNMVLDTETLKWSPAIEKPKGAYIWNNTTGEWVKYVRPTNSN